MGRFPEAKELKQRIRDVIAPDKDLGMLSISRSFSSLLFFIFFLGLSPPSSPSSALPAALGGWAGGGLFTISIVEELQGRCYFLDLPLPSSCLPPPIALYHNKEEEGFICYQKRTR